jgi:predicted PurR-regulated permease PerM
VTLTTTQRWVGLGALALLLAGAYWVLRPFLVPILWAAILVYATWPLFKLLRAALPRHPVLASGLMTGALILLLFGPAVALSLSLSSEIVTAARGAQRLLGNGGDQLLGWLRALPYAGEPLAERLAPLLTDPAALRQAIMEGARTWSGALQEVLGGAARNLVKLGIALMTAFFFYLHGHNIVAQVRRAADYLGGEGMWAYVAPITQTVNAVVFGLVLTALAQGLLAGIAYAIAGLPVPALLAAATALLALVPFGAPVVWVPAGIALVAQGDWLAGVGVLLWGMLVVSWVDNLIRPMVISASTRIPFLLIFFGVVGGAMAFGLIGLFVGPVILSVLLTLWKEWAAPWSESGLEPSRFDANGDT